LLDSLEFPGANITMVVNAAGPADGLSHYELARATSKSIDVVLPDVGKAANAALARGAPVIAVAPHSRFARAIRAWVADLTGLGTREQSLWNRLRNR
jgi:MinD-like ATPase involved in chromosome partitioning or flagellar assembly